LLKERCSKKEESLSEKNHKLIALFLLSATSAMAQMAPPTQAHTVSQVIDFWVSNTEQLIVPAADAMPAAKFSFAPSNGEFSGVRTFAEQVKHLAAANYQLAAATLGEQPPAGTDHETAPDSVQTKTQVMDYLKGSFTSLHRAAAALNESNMDDPLPSKGNRTRLLMLIDALVHSSNHYGQMVEYLRMNNIVPPATRPKT
jgi:hypothetical protein